MSKRLSVLLALALFAVASAALAQTPVVHFTASSYTIPEHGNYYAYVHIVRDGDLSGTTYFNMTSTNVLTHQVENWQWALTKDQSEATLAVNIDGNTPLDDDFYDPGRGWNVVLSSVTNGTLGQPSSTTVTIVDDDVQPHLSINDLQIDEGTSTGTTKSAFTLHLTSPVGTSASVAYTVHDGSAKAGSDYIMSSGTAFFSGSETRVDLPFQIIADREPEADETFTVEITSVSNANVSVDQAVGTCTIVDDDGAVAPLSQRIAKGSKGSIQIRLGNPATSTETVLLQGGGPFLGFPSSVTIPAGSASADVDVQGLDTGEGTITVILPPSRGGRQFSCLVTVFDAVDFSIDPSSLYVPFGSSGAATAKIDPAPASPITVALTQTNPSIAEIPQSVVIDAKGTAAIPVKSIAAGSTLVTATLPDANGGTKLSFTVNVTVPAGLAITSLSQRTGRASGGETMKLFGNNMGGRCSVTFGGVPSQTSELPSGGAIAVTTPPHDVGVVDVAIRCGTSSYVLTNGFTYVASPLTLASVTPATGGARGGTIVVIRGTNLRTGQCSATFGGTAAHAIAWTATTSMTVAVPPHAAGAVPVTLTCGSDTATLATGFTYTAADDAPAAVSQIAPLRAAPGELVTLSGARFRLDDAIAINGITASASPLLGADSHTVTVPELPADAAAVTLRDAAGRTTAAGTLTVTDPATPTIANLDAHLTTAAEFVVSGTGFRPALTFALGPAILQPIALGSTSARFRVPPIVAAGPATFSISSGGGTTLASHPVDVTTSGVAVTTIAPQCSSREGKLLATIAGNGFADGAMVQFGTTYAPSVVVRDRFSLVAEVPPAFGASDVMITVINPDGTAATLTNAFTYKSAAEGGCTSRHRAVGR